jgi:excisionase family DNA binding protein
MAELCVSRATINRALAQGRLQAVKVGSKTLITSASIDDFWNSLPPAKFRAQRQKAA